MKRYCFYLVLLLTVTALNGCVKDDNPSPVIRNTTWKLTNGDRWYRFSFSDSRVYGQLYDRKYSETEYTTIDFYADYVEESEGGRHYFVWVDQEHDIKFWLYTIGPDKVVIEAYCFDDDMLSGWDNHTLFLRDEDPAGGYNF
ncbi:MAG: hypothetical protein IKM90_00025 [Bacteroidaceae bacterium]|jgi:hypothetical protein|nr:hypothetical protein [Bacteroidaceae bacterium]